MREPGNQGSPDKQPVKWKWKCDGAELWGKQWVMLC